MIQRAPYGRKLRGSRSDWHGKLGKDFPCLAGKISPRVPPLFRSRSEPPRLMYPFPRPFLFSLGILAVMAAVLIGCSERKPDEGITILRMATWASDSGFELERAIITSFEQANPDIRIELIYTPYDYYTEKLLTLSVSGDPPDVFWTITETLPYLASRGVAMDLTDKVANDPEIDTALYFPNALSLCSYGDRLYAMPRDVACFFTVYNKNIFDEAGVPYPEPGWTWDDFLETGKRLTLDENGDGRNERFAMTPYLMDVIYQNGGQILGEDGTVAWLNSPETVGALDWWSDTILEHGICPRAQEQQGFGGDLFVTERAAMTFQGPWMIGWYDEQCDFDWDIVGFPGGKAGPKARLLGLPIAISPKTEHPEEAYRLLKFLTYSQEAQTLQAELGIAMPARRDIADSEAFRGQDVMPPGIVHFIDAMQNDTVVENVFPFYSPVKKAYQSMMDTVNLGEMSPQEAGDHYQTQVEREIAKARRRGLL